MIALGTYNDSAVIFYSREGHFPHRRCPASARVQVSVRLTGADEPVIESIETWRCEDCGLEEHRDAATHDTLADALGRLPDPLPGEPDVDDLVEQMNADMALARREHAAGDPEPTSGTALVPASPSAALNS